MLPEQIRGACCILRWGVRYPEGMKKLTLARHLWVQCPMGACLAHVASTENLALWACWHLRYPSTGAPVGRCSCTCEKCGVCLNWTMTPWSLCISIQARHYSEMLKIPYNGVFAPVLTLWLWCCSIFSHCCSRDITKKLVPLSLGVILLKPRVFASRIVSCFREREDYN